MNSSLQFFTLVEEIVRAGVTVELSHSDGEIQCDLNTGMKSHCHLFLQADGGFRIDRRYNRSEVFEKAPTLSEVCERIADCHHGRTFYNGEWEQVLEDNGHPLNKEAMYI